MSYAAAGCYLPFRVKNKKNAYNRLHSNSLIISKLVCEWCKFVEEIRNQFSKQNVIIQRNIFWRNLVTFDISMDCELCNSLDIFSIFDDDVSAFSILHYYSRFEFSNDIFIIFPWNIRLYLVKIHIKWYLIFILLSICSWKKIVKLCNQDLMHEHCDVQIVDSIFLSFYQSHFKAKLSDPDGWKSRLNKFRKFSDKRG